MITYKVVNLWL